MSRVWGRHAPTRSLRKCRRIEEVKSRMDRKFSKIENLWPRDGSCPLPLRSKRIDRVCVAQRSAAMKAPVGLLSGRTVCDSRWRGLAPTSEHKRKIPPTQRSDGFCRVNQRQNESGVLRGGKFFRDNPRRGSVQNEHDHILWMVSNQSTKSVRFLTENTT